MSMTYRGNTVTESERAFISISRCYFRLSLPLCHAGEEARDLAEQRLAVPSAREAQRMVSRLLEVPAPAIWSARKRPW
jgi:hypothetical protein